MCVCCIEKEVSEIIPHALIRPYLKYCVQLLGPQHKEGVDLLDSIQSKVMKRIAVVLHQRSEIDEPKSLHRLDSPMRKG